jgi:hypothetical protein
LLRSRVGLREVSRNSSANNLRFAQMLAGAGLGQRRVQVWWNFDLTGSFAEFAEASVCPSSCALCGLCARGPNRTMNDGVLLIEQVADDGQGNAAPRPATPELKRARP